MITSPRCKQCGKPVQQRAAAVNRALRERRPLYCDRRCAGLARRLQNPPTVAEKRAAKAAYDAARRAKLADQIKAQKRAHYAANRERLLAEMAVRRAKFMWRHVEYCRRPEYRQKKSAYDTVRRAVQDFGEFAQVALLLRDVDAEIESRATKQEIAAMNGTLNKAQTRRRML